MIGPFFKVFGSKWSAARACRYPEPLHDVIFEPFAGGAGYSCKHYDREIVVREYHPEIVELWMWLIREATQAAILEIPILDPETDIRAVGMCRGQELLVKWWQRTNNHGTRTWMTSPWCNKPGQWTSNTRSRVAEQVSQIKHWTVLLPENKICLKDATVFIDPPYQYNYQYGSKLENSFFEGIAQRVRECEADGCQVIACEAIGKNGEVPNYLPFRSSHKQVTSRRKTTESHHSSELIYVTH